MDEATYKTWWPLHLRAVSGETLSEEERAFYETRLAQLHQEEVLHEDVEALRAVREEIQRLDSERLQLQARRVELQAKIKALESTFGEPTRKLLAVGE